MFQHSGRIFTCRQGPERSRGSRRSRSGRGGGSDRGDRNGGKVRGGGGVAGEVAGGVAGGVELALPSRACLVTCKMQPHLSPSALQKSGDQAQTRMIQEYENDTIVQVNEQRPPFASLLVSILKGHFVDFCCTNG